MDARQIAAKIAAASATGNGNYFHTPGRGVAKVKEIKLADGFKGLRVQFDFEIESNVADGANAPGSSTTVIFKIGDSDKRKADMYMGKAKAVVLALAGAAESEVSQEDLIEEIVNISGKDQPRKGQRVAFEVMKVKTNAGEEIDVPVFTNIPDSAQAA